MSSSHSTQPSNSLPGLSRPLCKSYSLNVRFDPIRSSTCSNLQLFSRDVCISWWSNTGPRSWGECTVARVYRCIRSQIHWLRDLSWLRYQWWGTTGRGGEPLSFPWVNCDTSLWVKLFHFTESIWSILSRTSSRPPTLLMSAPSLSTHGLVCEQQG